MRSLTLICLVAFVGAADLNPDAQQGTFWLRDGRMVTGYWDPVGVLGSGIYVETSTRELGADKQGIVHEVRTPGPVNVIAAKAEDIVDRSPPEDAWTQDVAIVGVIDGTTMTVEGAGKKQTRIRLAYVTAPTAGEPKKDAVSEIMAFNEPRRVRLWCRTSSRVTAPAPDKTGAISVMVLLGDRGSKSLQAHMVSQGLAIANARDVAPNWWGKQIADAQVKAKTEGAGLWKSDPAWAAKQAGE